MSIYPKLEDNTMADADGFTHRLQRVREIEQRLKNEQEKRASLYKKYRRAINIVDRVDSTLLVLSMGLGIGGVSLLSTVVAAPVVVGLEIAALSCGIFSGSGKLIARRSVLKAKKHDEIKILAASKLNTIADYVSTAFIDNEITAQEFKLVLDELLLLLV